MSEENVEVLRSLVERWNTGDRKDMSAFHPDVEWLPLRVATEGAYRGIAGIERFIADEQGDPEEQAMDRFLSEEIENALRTLPPRDAKVLRLYFGLDGGREHTLEEIGGMLGVTRERGRQLRDRALKRLREGDVGRALASFAA